MNKKIVAALGALLAAVIGLFIFHVVHHVLYCRHRTDPLKSHCRNCGHRRICQKYHRRKWQGRTKSA